MTEITVGIGGMSCQHCVMRVKRALEGLPGIKNLSVEVGQAKVTFDESALSKDTIENAIVKAGYRIGG